MKTKILIVEDHDDFRELVKNHLAKEDFPADILEADCAEVGLALALRTHPQVVVMDIRLPGMSGLEAAEQIKEKLPDSQVIFLTMFETETFRKVFETEVVRDYIFKSELYDKLVPSIRRILKDSHN